MHLDHQVRRPCGQGTTRDYTADVVLEYIRLQGTNTPTIEGRIVELNP